MIQVFLNDCQMDSEELIRSPSTKFYFFVMSTYSFLTGSHESLKSSVGTERLGTYTREKK